MGNKRDSSKAQPALVPLHGSQDKKPRLLDRDSIIVGRARGCDIGLDAPDISNLHCVISRTPEGYRIRDCGSRSGTKVNGDSVKTATLLDGDVLQLGLFSFTVHVPTGHRGLSVDGARLEKSQKSRRRLAERAIKLRQKLRNLNDMGVTRTPTELNRKAAQIKNQIRGYDQRLAELEQSERELEQERNKLQQERESHRNHVQQVERDIGTRLGQADNDIRKRWQEFQQRCQQEEVRLTKVSKAAAAAVPPPVAQDLQQLQQQLSEQKEELEGLARELEVERDQIDVAQQHLNEEMASLRKQRQEIGTMQEQLNSQKAQIAADQDRLQASLAQFEASLSEQRQTLALLLNDVGKIHETLLTRTPDGVPQPDLHEEARVRVIEEENDQLRVRLRDLEKQLASSHTENKDLGELCGDHDLLRQLLKDEQGTGSPNVAVDKLQAENECLSQLLQVKETEIATLKKEATPVSRGTLRESDLENYEGELNQYRRQLDEDRAKLNVEIEQMRLRNAEMDDSVREMEMEMSRERAELARERTRLDRLREEVRIEMERLQRDAPVRESLVGVQKLREEMNKGKQPTPSGNGLTDRLKGLRNRLSEK